MRKLIFTAIALITIISGANLIHTKNEKQLGNDGYPRIYKNLSYQEL